MSTETFGNSYDVPPMGLKILCVLNGTLSVGSFLFILVFVFAGGFVGIGETVTIDVLTVSLVGVFTLLNLVLLYFLYQLNRAAYVIYLLFVGFSLLSNVLSFNIIGLLINGLIFGYLLSINEYF